MQQAVLTSPSGVRCRVGWLLEVLIDYGMENYTDKQITREIMRLGQKLERAAGPLAPAVVLVNVERYLSKGYANYVAGVWRLDELDDEDMDPANMPSLALDGQPPARRRA